MIISVRDVVFGRWNNVGLCRLNLCWLHPWLIADFLTKIMIPYKILIVSITHYDNTSVLSRELDASAVPSNLAFVEIRLVVVGSWSGVNKIPKRFSFEQSDDVGLRLENVFEFSQIHKLLKIFIGSTCFNHNGDIFIGIGL